jgi:hypothetical protein
VFGKKKIQCLGEKFHMKDNFVRNMVKPILKGFRLKQRVYIHKRFYGGDGDCGKHKSQFLYPQLAVSWSQMSMKHSKNS